MDFKKAIKRFILNEIIGVDIRIEIKLIECKTAKIFVIVVVSDQYWQEKGFYKGRSFWLVPSRSFWLIDEDEALPQFVLYMNPETGEKYFCKY